MKITTLLTTRYVAALLVLALVDVLGFFGAEYYIHDTTSTPRQIADAARLDTLSQVISLDLLQFTRSEDPAWLRQWRGQLEQDVSQFDSVYDRLTGAEGTPPHQGLRGHLRQELQAVRPSVQVLLGAVSAITAASRVALLPGHSGEPRVVDALRASSEMLARMDSVGQQIERDTERHSRLHADLDAVGLVGNLGILLLVGLLVIRPLALRMQRSNEAAMAANASLSRKLLELEESRKALQESEELFRSIAASAQDPIFMVDPDGRISFWNVAAEQVFGYSSADALRVRFGRLIVSDAPGAALVSAMDTVSEGGTGAGSAPGHLMQVTAVRGSGERFPAEFSISCVQLKGRRHVICVARDISEHRRTEAQLLRLATAVEQAVESIIITDRESHIQFVNPAFERLTGYTRDEVLGQTPRLLNSGRHDRAFYQDLWETILAGRTWRGHLVNRRKDGTLFEEEATISPVRDSSGQILNFIAVKRDVTQQVQLEAQLRQSQKLEAIGTLAGGIAHDFNNALTPILGFSELVLMKLPAESREHDYLERVGAAARRARDLVAQILLFSRKSEGSRRRLVLAPLVKETIKLLRSSLPATVSIELELGEPLSAVQADPTQISTLLMNLCINAAHAMPDGGVIHLSLGDVSLANLVAADGLPVSGRFVHLCVRDTGLGMDEKTLPRIFEPFFTTKEAGKGTGLGLSTVYGIVRQHNGAIQVASRPGEGSTFDVYFPVWDGDAPTEHAATAPPATVTGVNVLVVDDEEAITHLAGTLLESWGCRVSAFTDSRAALEAFQKNCGAYDVVISDGTMPGMIGEQLLAAMRRIRSDLPAVIMTGHDEHLQPALSSVPGHTARLQKPFSGRELGQSLAAVLQRQDL